MPRVYGYKLRWIVEEVACSVCEKAYDGTWFMVRIEETGDSLCRECLKAWKLKMNSIHVSNI